MRPRPCVDPAFSHPGARPAKAKSQSLYIPATRQPGPFEYGLNHSRSQSGQRKPATRKQSYWPQQPGLALDGSQELHKPRLNIPCSLNTPFSLLPRGHSAQVRIQLALIGPSWQCRGQLQYCQHGSDSEQWPSMPIEHTISVILEGLSGCTWCCVRWPVCLAKANTQRPRAESDF